MRDYANQVMELLKEKMDKDMSICVNYKNGMEMIGIVIKLEGNIAPSVYMKPFMEEGKTPEETTEEIMKILSELKVPQIDTNKIIDWEYAKNNVCAYCVGKKQNEKILEKCPWTDVEGSAGTLVWVYRVYLNQFRDEDMMSAMVTYEILKGYELMVEELHEVAIKNSMDHLGVSIKDMCDILREKGMPEYELVGMPSFTIISNEPKLYGFGAVTYPQTIDMLTQLYPDKKILVAPSSLHEAITIPIDEDDDELEAIRKLAEMVEYINATEVRPEDKLIDAVYKIEDRKFTLAYINQLIE